ncbi:MAG: fibronectin/fibrinogen-binding protein [Syntrophomonadaceae bacterium]|nr:fibronectin/fibrinogen-binding protein [Syntrophomonadaceae bacterium]
MPFDGLTIRAITKELQKDLIGGRIDKIYQPEKDEITIMIRQPKAANTKLLISANARWARIHTSSQKSNNPATPPNFCMLLRKYLEGGKIINIEQVDFERIIHIHIEALDDFREWKPKLLVCEIMGKHSNIILINPETNTIIDAIKKYGSETSSYREVLPGYEYITPPSQDKLNIITTNFETFTEHMWQQDSSSLAKAIFNVLSGISPFSAEHICRVTGINPDMPVEECGEYELITVYQYIRNLIEDIDQGKIEGQIIYKKNTPIEYALFPLEHIPEVRIKKYTSINETCDVFYSDKLSLAKLESQKINISRNIKDYLDKAYRKQYHLESDHSKAIDNDIYRIKGEIITANAYKLNKGDTEVELENFYTGETMKITLDPRYTPIQNAQRFFKIYNKSRSALIHLEQLMAKNKQEIDYLESVLVAVKDAHNIEEIEEIIEELEKEGYKKAKTTRKKEVTRSIPRRFISSDNLEILVGKNNRQNDILTLKEAGKNDLWLHTKDIPGTHVIVKLPEKINSIHEFPDKTLEEAAGLAAYYSKAQNSNKVPVDYTFRYNVRKPSGAKPGMVLYDNYWTIMANPQSKRILELVESLE